MTITWDWTRSLFWGWSEELLIKSCCLLCWFSLSTFYLSCSILKRSRDVKLLRSLLSDVLSFAVFLGLTNFSVWELSLVFLFWKYWLLYLEFSIISLMIVPLLQTFLHFLGIQFHRLNYWLTPCFRYLIKFVFVRFFLEHI